MPKSNSIIKDKDEKLKPDHLKYKPIDEREVKVPWPKQTWNIDIKTYYGEVNEPKDTDIPADISEMASGALDD